MYMETRTTSSQRWISRQTKRFENFCSIMERSHPKSSGKIYGDIAFEFKSQDRIDRFHSAGHRSFSKNFGPVESQSIVEIASDGHPLTIHVIKPSSQRKVLTLFTTGMSSRPMAVPQGVRGSKYAELYIQLPRHGTTKLLRTRIIIGLWFGFAAWQSIRQPTMLGSSIPYDNVAGKPLAVGPNLDFDSFMLFADQETRMDASVSCICIELFRFTQRNVS